MWSPILFLLISCTVVGSSFDFGVDTSNWGRAWSEDSLACVLNQGKRFVVVESYRRHERVPVGAVQTIVNAQRAGFQDVQLYHFPQWNVSAAAQMNETLAIAAEHNLSRVWVDVEGPQYWSKNCSENVKLLDGLVSDWPEMEQ